MICSRPDLYSGRGGNTLYFPVGHKYNHYYWRLVNSKLSFHIYRSRKLKTFEAVAWLPPIAWKPRTGAQFIVNALLFAVVGNARLFSCDGQLSFFHWNIQVDPSSYVFHKFNASLRQKWQVTDLLVFSCWSFCHFSMFSLSRSFHRFFNCNFREFLIALH